MMLEWWVLALLLSEDSTSQNFLKMIFRKVFSVSTLNFTTKKILNLVTAVASLISLENLVALIDEVGEASILRFNSTCIERS